MIQSHWFTGWQAWALMAFVLLLLLPCIFWTGHRLAYVAVLCGLLAVSVGSLWARNLNATEQFGGGFDWRDLSGRTWWTFNINATGHGISVTVLRGHDSKPDPPDPNEPRGMRFNWSRHELSQHSTRYPFIDTAKFHFWGLQATCFATSAGDRFTGRTLVLTAPNVLVMLAFFVVPAIYGRQLLHRRKARRWIAAGCCGHCGFDLRAHKPAEKCPECGTIIPGPRQSGQISVTN